MQIDFAFPALLIGAYTHPLHTVVPFQSCIDTGANRFIVGHGRCVKFHLLAVILGQAACDLHNRTGLYVLGDRLFGGLYCVGRRRICWEAPSSTNAAHKTLINRLFISFSFDLVIRDDRSIYKSG